MNRRNPKQSRASRSRPSGPAWLVRLDWAGPCALAFLASFCVMVVELVAGRLIARHLGASLYTWTSVIGVVLSGLAAGNYVGGRLADRFVPIRTLSVLLILGSASCLLSLPLNQWIGAMDALAKLDWTTRIALHVGLIFFWPAAVLGAIAPVVAKLALDQGRQTGRTVGNVYAWGAIGSIVGTFLTGYWFIAAMGSTTTLVLVSGVLAVPGILLAVHSRLSRIWTGTLVLLALFLLAPWPWARAATVDLGLRELQDRDIIYQTESAYSYIQVAEDPEYENLRSLTLDQLVHSWVVMDEPTQLHYEYEQIYAAATRKLFGSRQTMKALFLGGGGYTFPRYVEHVWPQSRIDVAEIDPAVTRAARIALGLDPNSAIRIHHMDARNYLDDLLRARRNERDIPTYDFVYGDAFNDYVIPFHLTTVEFNEKLRSVMADDGVYLLNVIDILASGRLLGALVNTLDQTFAHVDVYRARTGLSVFDPTSRDTFVVLASPRQIGPLFEDHDEAQPGPPGTRVPEEQVQELRERVDGLVLTDDYAPVETLLAPVYHRKQLEQYRRYNDVGLALAMKGDYATAEEYYRKALRLRSDFAEARSNLGWALFQQGRREEGIATMHEAIRNDPTLASAHNNLGWALYKEGRHAEAAKELQRAIQCRPDFALARNNLGLALAALGDMDQAISQYREAIRLQPGFAEAHYNLGSACRQLDRPDQAIAAYRRVIQLKPNHTEARNDLGWLLHKQGKREEAEAVLRSAVKTSPDAVGTMNNLAAVQMEEGKFDEAVRTLTRLLERHPGNVEACNSLGIAFAKLGKKPQAIRWWREALRFRPDYRPARDNLLALLLQDERFAEAIALLREAMRHSPEDPGVLSNLAWLLATCPNEDLRDGAEAVRLAKQANELSGGRSARVLDTLAAALAESQQYDQAITFAEKAQALAASGGNRRLANDIGDRLRHYRNSRPYRHGR